jgi:hypothetical protein
MTRLAAIVLTISIGLAGPAALVACDSSEQRTRIPKSRLKPTVSWDDLTPEQQAAEQARREEAMKNGLIWPDGQGPPRDPVADYRDCQAELKANHAASTANALVQMVWMGRCITDKGWLIKADLERQKEEDAG